MEWFLANWQLVVIGVFGLLSLVFGAKLQGIKRALKEVDDVIDVVRVSLDDNKITAEELKDIVAEVIEAVTAILAVFNKR